MRTSLLTRLSAVSVLVAICAIAATAWLAARTTTGAIRQEQGRSLAADARIYTTLLAWAAGHDTWDGVRPTLETLAQHTDRRVTLLAADRTPIADSASTDAPLPATASAVIDPLAIDPQLVPDSPADRIAPQAVGPYLLPDNEKADLAGLAERTLSCVQLRAGPGRIVTGPSGRPRIESQSQAAVASCSERLSAPTATETAALSQLDTLVNGCLARVDIVPVRVNLDWTWTWTASGPASQDIDEQVAECVTSGRREQLTPYVAPAARLFVTSPSGAPPSPFDLSAGNQVRIALAAAAVLLVAVAITLLAGRRLTRPLRALTAAARRMRDGDDTARVAVRGKDELAELAAAFNDMSAARERLERQRKDLISDIAHELRTPLSNIRGWLEATEDGLSTPDPAWISSLLEEAHLLQHIIDDLQDLALADAGALRLHPVDVDAADLLAQVRAAHASQAADAGVTLRIEADPLPFTADPLRLRQALGNLVGNAIRHTPRGGEVTLRAASDGDDVVLAVADTGTGIAEADLPHVFDRFWRAERSRSRQTGGSGLGLAIVRKLAETHGGTATVASEPGRGATVTLRIPHGALTPPS